MFRKAMITTALLLSAQAVSAQTFTTPNPTLQRMWEEGINNSQVKKYAQALLDSVGPRLTGSPGHKAGNDWLVAVYKSLGIDARQEQYGTWKGWRRGITHADLLTPRVRSLEGMMLAWSPGTPRGQPVQGTAIVLPQVENRQEFQRWLQSVRGKFVLISYPRATCRPMTSWNAGALPEVARNAFVEDSTLGARWRQRTDTTRTGIAGQRALYAAIEQAGALGLISSNWSSGWGVEKIFNASTELIPTVQLSCEDYTLVYRLAENGDTPTLRVAADAEFLGDVPVFNTIAEIKGSEKPNEYVMLSAHFDSWDGSSGATDNGTGTITMLEAMRIVKAVYPNPKRTILVGHWGGEEQGLIGSRSFAAAHPEIVQGLQALWNQDNGTGHVQGISAAGLARAGDFLNRWHAALPTEISKNIRISSPGSPSGGGSDNASFICYGAPAFSLSAAGFDYSTYTWHTNRDTYDKISFENLRNNATLTAMLVYLASEEPEKIPRDRADLGMGRNGQPNTWPNCATPTTPANYFRR